MSSLVPRLSFSGACEGKKESLVSTVCACSKITFYFEYAQTVDTRLSLFPSHAPEKESLGMRL